MQADALIMFAPVVDRVEHVGCYGCKQFNQCGKIKRYCPLYNVNRAVDFGPEYITVGENDCWKLEVIKGG